MSLETIFALFGAAMLGIYLIYALLKPEKF